MSTIMSFGLFENKRVKNKKNKKLFKAPHDGIIKTLCAKKEACKSIGIEELQRLKRKILENRRKMANKGPKIKISEKGALIRGSIDTIF